MQNLSWAACDSGAWRREYNKPGVWRKAGEGAWGVSHLKPDMLWSSTGRVSCRVYGVATVHVFLA